MSKVLVLIISFFLIVGCSGMQRNWSKEDTMRHVVFTGLKLADFSQTMKIADNPDDYYELNPILGKHPSREDVIFYFVGTYVAETALAYLLPDEYRPWFQYLLIGSSAICVGNNLSIGLGVGF